MTEVRDVYLLTKSTKPSDDGNPFNLDTTYKASLAPFCRVNEMGAIQQAALFAGKVYNDAKIVIVPVMVMGHADKLAFYDEYNPDTQSGVIYDVTIQRNHTNSAAFYVVNTKAGLVNG